MKKNIRDKNIILFGVGAVNKCICHYIDKYFDFDPNKLLMIDLIDYQLHPDVQKWIKQGAKYLICDLNKEYVNIISKLNPYDIIFDLSNRTDTIKFTEEALKNNIHIINTSLEDPISPNMVKKKYETLKQTYQASHNEILTLKNRYKEKATCLMCAGENPGLISLMHKLAIKFLANSKKMTPELRLYLNERDWGRLCKYLNIQVIHCSETDSAKWNKGESKDTKAKFNNTWCVQAFSDELGDNLQMMWSSEQKKMPKGAEMLGDHLINFNRPSKDIYYESYVPKVGKFIGCCISHSEQISGEDVFSTADFSPSMFYVYRLSPITQTSLKRMNKNLIGNTFPPNSTHVVNNYDDDFTGEDIVGSLILSGDDKNKAVWAGSILSNKESHIGLHSATTSQVAVGVLSFMHWILDNPNKGCNFTEVVDEEYILRLIKPYYGYWCGFVDYKPSSLQFADMVKTKKQYDAQF